MIFPLKRFTVSGNSMLPTLKPNQDVLVWCWFLSLKKGDLVVFEKDNRIVVKRILSFLDREIIVMGDNEKMSTDSRNFGPIKKEEIIGKVIWN